jgi:ribosome-associated toxin RatA of RatAB toxin-antitoxin module
MDIHFNHTEPVDAPAETLFEVITDYAGYPRFNPAVIRMTVVAKDRLAWRGETKKVQQVRCGFSKWLTNFFRPLDA